MVSKPNSYIDANVIFKFNPSSRNIPNTIAIAKLANSGYLYIFIYIILFLLYFYPSPFIFPPFSYQLIPLHFTRTSVILILSIDYLNE